MPVRFPIAFLCLALAACAQPRKVDSHAEWMKEATRIYAGEDKARVIAAAEAVLKHADGADTRFEYSLGGFVATRPFSLNALVAGVNGEDRWTFSVRGNKAGAATALRVIRSGTATAANKRSRFRDNAVYIGSFRLFYARVEYVLGRRVDWVSCHRASTVLNLPEDSPGTDLLCSLTHQATEAPPAKLPLHGSAPKDRAQSDKDALLPPDLPPEPKEPED
jgi:hypothetical protein